jgi:hypothetical protein
VPLDIPVLFLTSSATLTHGKEERFEVFRRYAPGARHKELKEWGARLHEEAGGHELADKVIPFIQEVIAQRQRD